MAAVIPPQTPQQPHASPMQQQGYRLPKRLRDKPQKPLDQYLIEKAEQIEKKCKYPETIRAQISVTLQRRFRGATLDDLIGIFSPNPNSTDWLSVDVSGLKPFNIVKPIVRFNQTTMVTSNTDVFVKPAAKDPRKRGAAGVMTGLVEHLDAEHWTQVLKERTSQLSQLNFGYALRVEECECDDYSESQEWGEEEDSIPGEYACYWCGSGGTFDGQAEPDELGLGTTQCPDCGRQAEVTKAPEQSTLPVPQGKSYKQNKDIKTTVATSYEIRIDERRSQGGNLDEAKWFEYHHTQTRDELEDENPDIDLGTAQAWSYPIKWQYALETGTNMARGSNWSQPEDIYEAREIYLLPDDYRSYVSPTNFKFEVKGEVVFEIQAGQRLIDVRPKGCVFKIANKKLVTIRKKEKCNDFRKEWAMGGFLPDALSVWPQPLVELLQLSDDAMKMYTIGFQDLERNAINQIVYDPELFDAESWEQDLVPIRPGYDREAGIGSYYAQVQSVPLKGPFEALNLLVGEFLQKIGLVQPAALGETAPGEPYAAQLLQKQSSMGLLASAGKSSAEAKVRHFKNAIRAIRDAWPKERYEQVAAQFGGEWKADDLEAFFNADLDKDFEYGYTAGSEVPETTIERNVKLQAFISKLVEIAANLQRPELVTNDLIAQLGEAAGVDLDLQNREANERLAQFRYDLITESLQEIGAEDMQGANELMSDPHLNVLQGENHQVHIEFWADHELALMAQPELDQPLIVCCDIMVRKHKSAMVADAQEKSSMGVAAQQPQLQAAQQAQGAQAEQQAQTEQVQSASEEAKTQAENARTAQEAERQRQHESAESAADRTHEAGLAAMQHAAQSKQKEAQAV